MGQSSRRALLLVLSAVLAAAVSVACSDASGTSGAVGTGGQTDAAVAVASSARGVILTNTGRYQLSDVQVAIHPSGNAPTFERTLPSLGVGERKEVPLTDFKSSDNVTLNPMFIRPEEITLTAKDETGQDVNVTVPWK
jgi:hypothetical protein